MILTLPELPGENAGDGSREAVTADSGGVRWDRSDMGERERSLGELDVGMGASWFSRWLCWL